MNSVVNDTQFTWSAKCRPKSTVRLLLVIVRFFEIISSSGFFAPAVCTFKLKEGGLDRRDNARTNLQEIACYKECSGRRTSLDALFFPTGWNFVHGNV